MGRIITFNTTRMGASHVKSGKPCQDYSLSWKSDDDKVLVCIVCDGHGGDTYVRSDVGSRLAAEISLKNIQEFIQCTPASLFLDTEAAVTARPDENDSFFGNSKLERATADMSESQLAKYNQDKSFRESVKDILEQDSVFTTLFARIYVQWMNAINQDAQNNPFSDEEKSLLKDARIAKAYGTTLMAFVRTPLYWFAFHIGDGKLLCCDAALNWREPVPWDCNCFLNITTSLCLREPLNSFRYAFSGKGDFPAAVMMGSDGIDDTWCTLERLQNFYSQTLSIFDEIGPEEAVKQLGEYLPTLSAKGSRDDVSIAGIIDLDAIKSGVAAYKIRRSISSIMEEKTAKEKDISALKGNKAELEVALKKLQENHSGLLDMIVDFTKKLANINEEKAKREAELKSKTAELDKLNLTLKEKEDSYKSWATGAKEQKLKLDAECAELLTGIQAIAESYYQDWLRERESFETANNLNMMEKLNLRVREMQQFNDEAIIGIRKADEQSADNAVEDEQQ